MSNKAPKPTKTVMFRLYDNRKNHNLILNWLESELPQTNRGTDICFTLENMLLAHIKKTCTIEDIAKFKDTPCKPRKKNKNAQYDNGHRVVGASSVKDEFSDFDSRSPLLRQTEKSSIMNGDIDLVSAKSDSTFVNVDHDVANNSRAHKRSVSRLKDFVKDANFD